MLWQRSKKPATRERRFETPGTSSGQLTWLVIAILLAGAPHLLYVHPWVPVVVVMILTWRIIAARKRWSLPNAWILVPLTLFGFIGVLFSYRQISGLSAGSALLLVMAAMKLLETRGHRDRAIVVFICYFLLFATFLREQAIWSAGYLILGVLVTTAALIQTSRIGPAIPASKALTLATRLFVESLPIALLLFLLFPRIPGPFWTLPNTGGQATAGLSNELSPGDISELALSDKVAFRVRFETQPPESSALYWRGPVMDNFDGRKWTQQKTRRPAVASRITDDGPTVDYEVTLEPHGQRWLLALETPLAWDAPDAQLSITGQLLKTSTVDRRLSYRGTSILGNSHNQGMNAVELQHNRKVPGARNPRSIALAKQLRNTAGSDRDFVQQLMQYFAGGNFYYTLRPPSLGENPVDEFLFESQRGFCGHYASAFALLARAGGIPTRIVTGYQGAERNPLANYWFVRQSDAHAWVETWLDDRWVRFDPTAMVAPDRIEYGFDAAMQNRGAAVGNLLATNPLLVRLSMSWDALNTAWNRWVLSFGPETQSTILSFVGFSNPSIEHLIVVMAISITGLLVAIGIAQRYRTRPRIDTLLAAYNRLCQRIGKVARHRQPSEGPHEYLSAVSAQRPDLAAELCTLFDMYMHLRYDGIEDERLRKKFLVAVRSFSPPDTLAAG